MCQEARNIRGKKPDLQRSREDYDDHRGRICHSEESVPMSQTARGQMTLTRGQRKKRVKRSNNVGGRHGRERKGWESQGIDRKINFISAVVVQKKGVDTY